MHNKSPREKCGLCNKFIYTHDIILVCSFDHLPYHAKCLKIENDTALELQSYADWFCPLCIENILPIHACTSKKESSINCYSVTAVIT